MKFRLGQKVTWTPSYFADGYQVQTAYVVSQSKEQVVTLRASGTIARFLREQQYQLTTYAPEFDAKVLCARRKDGYDHFALIIGRKMVIRAGCHTFHNAKRAIAAWTDRRRAEWAYDKKAVVHIRGVAISTYDKPGAIKRRAYDNDLNKWSRAFVRKAERLRTRKVR